jgi:hypothetical protein
MHTYRNRNFEFYVCIDTKGTNLELVVTLYVYAHMHKEITFYVFFGEKRDPSEIYANSNLRNLTHITQKPSYIRFSPTRKKSQPNRRGYPNKKKRSGAKKRSRGQKSAPGSKKKCSREHLSRALLRSVLFLSILIIR